MRCHLQIDFLPARQFITGKVLTSAGGKRRIYNPNSSSCCHTHSEETLESNISWKLFLFLTEKLQQFPCRCRFSALLCCKTQIFGTKQLMKGIPCLLADGSSHPNLQQAAEVGWNLISNTARGGFCRMSNLYLIFPCPYLQFVNKPPLKHQL